MGKVPNGTATLVVGNENSKTIWFISHLEIKASIVCCCLKIQLFKTESAIVPILIQQIASILGITNHKFFSIKVSWEKCFLLQLIQNKTIKKAVTMWGMYYITISAPHQKLCWFMLVWVPLCLLTQCFSKFPQPPSTRRHLILAAMSDSSYIRGKQAKVKF